MLKDVHRGLNKYPVGTFSVRVPGFGDRKKICCNSRGFFTRKCIGVLPGGQNKVAIVMRSGTF